MIVTCELQQNTERKFIAIQQAGLEKKLGILENVFMFLGF